MFQKNRRMNPKNLKLLSIFLLLLPLCVAFFGTGCHKENENSDFVEGYIVGSFIGEGVNAAGQASGSKTKRGYCILIEGGNNKHMDFYTFNFPNALIAFPNEILTPSYNGSNCGPTFFPDNLKYAYKIKFKYRIVDEEDKVQFITGPCTFWLETFHWESYDQVILNETIRF
jgi:hypothetical protein